MTGSREQLESREIRTSIQALVQRNRDWNVVVFSDEKQQAFIRTHYSKEFLDHYLAINPRYGAARADFFRYLAIYKAGGVYLDIKSACLLPLDTLITPQDSLLLAQWDNQVGRKYAYWGLWPELWNVPGGEYVNWFFAATTKHPILLEVISQIIHNIQNYTPTTENLGRPGILRTTGPIAWTQALSTALRRQGQQQGARIINSGDHGLIYSIFDLGDQAGGQANHRGAFQHHYSNSAEPVVIHTAAGGAP